MSKLACFALLVLCQSASCYLEHHDIVTIAHQPYTYVTRKDDGTQVFSGFIPDLIEIMSEKMGFTYKFKLSDDGKFGTLNQIDGTWTGMMGELVTRQVDMIAAPLTITSTRHRYVDFVQPFSHIGLSVVIQKPSKRTVDPVPEPKSWHYNFDVFKPLSAGVWVTVTFMTVVVWLFLWLLNRFNPYEYGERYKRNLATEDEAGWFSLTGSLWFTFTTLQWQGYDRAPRSLAAKVLGCFWMVFVTLTIVTYISSYVNHMFWASTLHKHIGDPNVSPIRDLIDLVNHKDGYTYGCVRGGATFSYLTEVAVAEEFKKMAAYWKTDAGKADLVSSTDEGIKLVRQKKYAFIGETMSMRHLVTSAENCDLMEIPGVMFGMRSYGLAVPHHNATWKSRLDLLILELIETGDIEALEDKWFNDRSCHIETLGERAAAARDSALYLDTPRRVSMHMFWSPIVLMTIGLVVSALMAVAEILWYRQRGRYEASNRQGGQQLTNEEDGHI